MDFNTNEFVTNDVCKAAAIYGLDAAPWAFTPNFPELKTYNFEMEDMGGNKTNCEVNEVQCAIGAAEGKRNPCDAGVRLGNEKYMFINHNEGDGVTQLSKRGGGASCMKIGTAVIIAIWDKECKQSDEKFQTGGNCAEQVAVMGAYLKE